MAEPQLVPSIQDKTLLDGLDCHHWYIIDDKLNRKIKKRKRKLELEIILKPHHRYKRLVFGTYKD